VTENGLGNRAAQISRWHLAGQTAIAFKNFGLELEVQWYA